MKITSRMIKATLLASSLASLLAIGSNINAQSLIAQAPTNSAYFSDTVISNNISSFKKHEGKLLLNKAYSNLANIEVNENRKVFKERPERRDNIKGNIESAMDKLEHFKYQLDERAAPAINDFLYERSLRLSASGDMSAMKIGPIDYQPLKLTIHPGNNENGLVNITNTTKFDTRKDMFNGIKDFMTYSLKTFYEGPATLFGIFDQNKK